MVLGRSGGRLGQRASRHELALRTDIAIEAVRVRVEFIVNVLNRRVRLRIAPA